MMMNNSTPATDSSDLPESLPLSDLRAQRLAKLDELRQAGIDPFGTRVDNLISTADALRQFEQAEQSVDSAETRTGHDHQQAAATTIRVKLAGRLTAMRIMGKSIFADLRDQSGRMQVYAKNNNLGDEQFNWFKKLDIGDIVTVEGTLFRTRMGEVTATIESFQLLSKSLRPLPEKWHGLTDIEQRYRQRYLDLISNQDVRETFRKRIMIIREIRRFLDERGFLEVETPMLQPIPGGAAARPFETYYAALDAPMYMRIAPELFLKRLLVGGFEKVYEINRNFRNEGLSRRHNPEFTMVEIYQAYSDCTGMMNLIEELIVSVAQNALGSLLVNAEEANTIDLTPPWRRVTYAELIKERMGADWYELPLSAQRQKAKAEGLAIDADMDEAAITHEIYEKLIERTLLQPTFVTRLPAALVPLAKRHPDDPATVDVFELEIGGQEIAPGYSELNDPVEQRQRFEKQAARVHGTVEEISGRIDEDFLVAMEHGMPPAGGMGMGIDRLIMLLTANPSIRDVILFPQMRTGKAQG